MARFINKSQTDIGESPFEMRFRGSKKSDKIFMRVLDFDADNLEELKLKEFKEISKYLHTDTVTWLNVDGLHDSNLIQQIGEVFELDRMIMSEVLNTDQRPKIQEYNDCLFVSCKMLQFNEKKNQLISENLSLVISDKLLISFQERRGDVFEPVRDRIRKQKKKIRTSGTDYLAFALIDIVIDNYIYILSLMGDRIESLEEKLINNPKPEVLILINEYKREINFMRKNIMPAKEMAMALVKSDTEFLDDDNVGVHLKELLDNINQAVEISDSYREILSDQLNIYHMTLSSKLNDVMKFLTIFSVIFIPLTFIAGIYGTNFDHLPELHYEYSYFIMWGVMISVTLGMLYYFKKKDWF
jgi:magnesium transporter